MGKKDDFVHLHTHSDFSQLDGCGKAINFIHEAARRGNPALAFTEHGSMRGWYTFIQEIESEKLDLKAIPGIEFYVAKDMRRRGLKEDEREDATKGLKPGERKGAIKELEDRLGIRDRWHLTCWALTDEGLKNLYRLSSKAWIEGFYYKPRIDMAELIKHQEGLAVSTGCCSSPVNDSWILGRKREAMEFAEGLYEVFGDRLYLEVQPHNINEPKLGLIQHTANKLQLALRKRFPDAKLLATQDAHYIHKEDAEHHEVMLCIGTGTNLSDPTRFKFDGDEFHLRTRADMLAAFNDHHGYMGAKLIKEALDSTVEFADRVTATTVMDRFKALLPDVAIPPEYSDEFEYIKGLCYEGWKWREIPDRARRQAARKGITYDEMLARYIARFKSELSQIRKQKFVRYFLIVRDLYSWTRKNGIAGGPGRGSAGGSLVAFLLGIVAVDPLEHELLFERFISPSRIDMPDIDMDFEHVRRGEVIQYFRDTYGIDKVCQISTIGKLSGKQCLTDVARVLEVPLIEVKQVTASIIERSSGDERASATIEDSFKEFKVCQDFNAKHPKVLHHAKHLEGMAKTLGIHAAGVIASPVPLTDVVPLEVRKPKEGKGEPVVVCAFDMYGAAAMGLLKYDVLGLENMTIIRMACEAIQRRHGVTVDMEKLELNDHKVLQAFTDHEYVGIFQYDTPGADKICSGVVFSDFEDVAAMTALNRPGTSRSGLATQFVARKKNPALVSESSYHPRVTEITKDTLGIIVYQEHVLRIFIEVAGFSPATADSLRKTIAKKIGDETIGRERENFIKGAMKTTPGMTEEVAAKIIDAITFFGSYGFNKSHATEYGVIAYWCMWLKVNYPLEFYWALMVNEKQRLEIQRFVKDARRHGIEVLQPDVNISGDNFTIVPDKSEIRGSLADIKNVGDKAAAVIMREQPFKNFGDFLKRCKGVNRRVVDNLLRSGALDSLVPNPRWAAENLDAIWDMRAANKWEELATKLSKSRKEPVWTEEDRMIQASQINPLAFGKHPMDAWGGFFGEHMRVKLASMGDEDFFTKHRQCFIAGVMVERKYNQVGDFHTGALPSKEEQARMKWGARYANINLEDTSGKQNRCKVDWDIFDDHRAIVDSGLGTPIVAFVSLNKKYENMRAHFMVNVKEWHAKIKEGRLKDLTVFERILMDEHPAVLYPWDTEKLRKDVIETNIRTVKKETKSGRSFKVTGVITHLKTKPDKNDNEMAWFGLMGVRGFIEVVVFGSSWPTFRDVVKPGRLVTCTLEKLRDGGCTLGDRSGSIKWRKRSLSESAETSVVIPET
jgi:DNA polymerase-3 subunit alpha